MKKERFTIQDFNDLYLDKETCLQRIFEDKCSNLDTCEECDNPFRYYKVSNRKCYSCAYCGYQIHPLANTIFHKSSTSLKSWFYAMYLFSTSKNGVSAKELERQLGVTYKTAWRMAKQIRKLFDERIEMLKNDVEIDETYIGGKELFFSILSQV